MNPFEPAGTLPANVHDRNEHKNRYPKILWWAGVTAPPTLSVLIVLIEQIVDFGGSMTEALALIIWSTGFLTCVGAIALSPWSLAKKLVSVGTTIVVFLMAFVLLVALVLVMLGPVRE